MCRGEAHGDEDRLTIPCFSRSANSALAMASFSASSRRKGEAMGGPEVCKKCTTPCDDAGRTWEGVITSEKSLRIRWMLSGVGCAGATEEATGGDVEGGEDPGGC